MASTPARFERRLIEHNQSRSLNRSRSKVEETALVRAANVRATAFVQKVKIHEIDDLTREAMSGHGLLMAWGTTLAHGDPFVADELKFFTDVARIGKGEVLADTISNYCDEGRR